MNEPATIQPDLTVVAIPPGCEDGVARQLARLAEMASRVMDFPLDERLEPASLVPDTRDRPSR
jgi:hypothetical protein